MTRSIVTLAAAFAALSLACFALPASAATAHNLQKGTSTKNANDTMMSERMKQHRMMPMRQKRMMMHHRMRGRMMHSM